MFDDDPMSDRWPVHEGAKVERACGLVWTLGVVLPLAACIKDRRTAGNGDGHSGDTGADALADTREVGGDSSASDVDMHPDTGTDIGTRCGNGRCEAGETRLGCPVDCGCGNGTCEDVETSVTCPLDCCGDTTCGDCACDSACGETPTTCPRDCWACGDGVVSPGEIDCGCLLDACRCPATGGAGCGDGCCMGYLCQEDPTTCARDCGSGCGNAQCEPGETPLTCAEDCAIGVCGNGLCEGGRGEDPTTCAADCAAACGNCVCEPGETYLNCPPDCGLCGDGVCSNCPALNEREGCAADCGPNESR